jgi:peptidoglycan/xylan/chitin deacetylase (PgdA/CDA1 family)
MLARRSVLTALPALALAACAAPTSTLPAGARAAGAAIAAGPGAVPAHGAPEAPAPTGPARPPRPGLEQVEHEFAGRLPSAWGLQVPGVVTRVAVGSVALTFDACGGPGGAGYDGRLIGTLRKHRVPATLFLNARWIAANPGAAAELAADPLFELADHGTAHRPLSVTGRAAYGIPGTASVAAVYQEILSNRAHLEGLAHAPGPWYRPGTAYYDDVAADVVRAVGLVPVNFSLNGDGGATFSPAQVATEVARARAGDIVISHMNHPGRGTAPGYEAALPRLIGMGITFTTLSRAGLPWE